MIKMHSTFLTYLLIYEKITEKCLHMSGILSYSYKENKNNHRRIQLLPFFMGKKLVDYKGESLKHD